MFKIGDKVRKIASTTNDPDCIDCMGEIGTVVGFDISLKGRTIINVDFDSHKDWAQYEDELELVPEKSYYTAIGINKANDETFIARYSILEDSSHSQAIADFLNEACKFKGEERVDEKELDILAILAGCLPLVESNVDLMPK